MERFARSRSATREEIFRSPADDNSDEAVVNDNVPGGPGLADEPALKRSDELILEYGIRNVVNKITEDFDGLPDAIILPDTSARPLMHALRPVFKKVMQERGAAMPRFYFFKTARMPQTLDWIEQKTGTTVRSEEELIQLLLEEYGKGARKSNQPAPTRKEIVEQLIDVSDPIRIEEINLQRESMRKRAEEIRRFESKRFGRETRLAIIDDFRFLGSTERELFRAFGTEIPSYSIYSDSAEADGERSGLSARLNDLYRQRDDGTRDMEFGSTRFKYSQTDSVGVRKDRSDGSAYARRINGGDPASAERVAKLKERLRSEMRTVGERAAETLHEDGYESFLKETGIHDENRERKNRTEHQSAPETRTDEYPERFHPRQFKSLSRTQRFWGGVARVWRRVRDWFARL